LSKACAELLGNESGLVEGSRNLKYFIALNLAQILIVETTGVGGSAEKVKAVIKQKITLLANVVRRCWLGNGLVKRGCLFHGRCMESKQINDAGGQQKHEETKGKCQPQH
jgi:hypothetical protein